METVTVGGKSVGPHREKRLTAAEVRNQRQAGFYADGHGLYLKVDPSGAKRWVQRLIIQGKRRDIGLGATGIVSLADAREAAVQNRKVARAGGDPLAVRRQLQAVMTFEDAAEKVRNLHLPTWRNPKHGQQWKNTLKQYVFPHFGKKRLDTVTSADVLAALSPIWNTHRVTARRVRQRIDTVMKWAIAQGWRTDNPAESISKALPKLDQTKVKHRKALPYGEVWDAIRHVGNSDAAKSSKLAFEFLVLTATRSGETRGALWKEFDLKNSEWTIPAERMKAKRPHRVPLPPRCVEILKLAKPLKDEKSDYVFPGNVAGKPLSDNTLSKLMRDIGIDAVPHGFRSSFRDWAGEQTNFPREVCEFALAHVIKDKAEAAYARSDLFEKRRKLMETWARYLTTRSGKVVPMAARA